MDIYIYYSSNQNVDIDEMEEEIEEILGEKGEVTGSGMGVSGGNLDIELFADAFENKFLSALRKLQFPNDTYYVIDGKKNRLY